MTEYQKNLNQLAVTLRERMMNLPMTLMPSNYGSAKQLYLELAAQCKLDVRPEFVYEDKVLPEPLNYSDLKRLSELAPVEQAVVEAFCEKERLKRELYNAVCQFRISGEREPVAELNRQLYGDIDAPTYRHLMGQVIKELFYKELRDDDREMFYDVLGVIGDCIGAELPENTPYYRPQDETVAKFRKLVEKEFNGIIGTIPLEEQIWPVEEVVNLINCYLAQFRTKFWAESSTSQTTITIDQPTRRMILPVERSLGPYTTDTVRNIVVGHETLVHLMRSICCEDDGTLLSLPLPGYGVFEEGLAKSVETALGGAYDPNVGIEHYLTIGLAMVNELSFRQVFEIRRKTLFLQKVERYDNDEQRVQKWQAASERAFRWVQRAFRGTGVVPLTSDLSYFNGYSQAWRYIESLIDQPKVLMTRLFYSGKTDPTNELHVALLQGYDRWVELPSERTQ